jgi:hypothetical protein
MSNRLLSKSKYMNGMQCLKYLWLVCNDPSKIPEVDASTQHIFDQGHLVGELAKQLYPEGINIPHDNFILNLNRAKESLKERKPLFEAGFMVNGIFARMDILNPAGTDAWDIIEVKSSTSIKDENIQDITFQKYCLEKSGLKINKCFLAFINNQYVKNGNIDPACFFTIQEITDEVLVASEGIQDRIQSMVEAIALRECPEMPVGSFCSSPYDCPVTICWKELPENNIFSLYQGGKKCFDLFYAGIRHLCEIPDDYKLNASQKIQKSCDISGKPHINKAAIKDFLTTIKSPIHYLDFETINPAVPLFDGTRPYQKIPFQFSLHIVGENGGIKHYGYLAEGTSDPRPAFLTELKNHIGPTGSIVTYNQSFEEGILRDLASAFPEYNDWVSQVCDRMVDLLEPFRNFYYYNPGQNGSASIKSVLPAITGKGYDILPIADGDSASRAFLNVTYTDVSEEECSQVRGDLEKYCGLDTKGMVWIVEKLQVLC